MGNVTQLRKTTLDQVIDMMREHGLTHCVVAGVNADGEVVTIDGDMPAYPMAFAIQILQARLLQDAGMVLSPDDIEYE